MRHLVAHALLCLSLGSFVALAEPALAQGTAGATTGAPAPVEAARPNPAEASDEDHLEKDKLRSEIAKLQREITKLEQESDAFSRASGLLSAVGGLAGAAVTVLVWFFGARLSEQYKLTQERAETRERGFHRERLDRDQALAREQQNVKLFANLASENARVQMAAAIVLFERLAEIRARGSSDRGLADKTQLEQRSIRGVLVAILKEDPTNPTQRRALLKHIAEELAKDLDALREQAHDLAATSPFRNWDLQRAQLADVYWRHADLRGVDFYQANFRHAGLRQAHLQGAIFYQADLTGAVLRGARVDGANFQGAKLCGADLRDLVLDGTILTEAMFDHNTLWPPDFDAAKAGAKQVVDDG